VSGRANGLDSQGDEQINIPKPPNDAWHGNMTLPRTKPDETLDASDLKCPGYKNANTAWWDGSQIYGSSEAITATLRSKNPDGKLAVSKEKEEFLPRDAAGNVLTGFNTNWWLGMEWVTGDGPGVEANRHAKWLLEFSTRCLPLSTTPSATRSARDTRT